MRTRNPPRGGAAVDDVDRDEADRDEPDRYEDDDEDDVDEEGYGELSVVEAGRAAAGPVAELTGKELNGVVSVEASGDEWLIGIEVVEDHRIPSSCDVLGLYAARVGPDGELLAYRRTRRYPRGRGGLGERSDDGR